MKQNFVLNKNIVQTFLHTHTRVNIKQIKMMCYYNPFEGSTRSNISQQITLILIKCEGLDTKPTSKTTLCNFSLHDGISFFLIWTDWIYWAPFCDKHTLVIFYKLGIVDLGVKEICTLNHKKNYSFKKTQI